MCRTTPTALFGEMIDQVEDMLGERFRDGYIRQHHMSQTQLPMIGHRQVRVT